jgi:hypothetical protein
LIVIFSVIDLIDPDKGAAAYASADRLDLSTKIKNNRWAAVRTARLVLFMYQGRAKIIKSDEAKEVGRELTFREVGAYLAC